MADKTKLAQDVLAAVGGKENVKQAMHCITRLRFILVDDKVPNEDEIKKIDGVLGVQRAAGQFQVIVGPGVPDVYKELCRIGGFDELAAVDENIDDTQEKQPWTAKRVGSAILDYLSGSMIPVVPAIMVAGLFRAIQSIMGPTMLGVLQQGDSFYTILDMVYSAAMYFLPIYLGFSAARKRGTSPILGMLMAGVLISPQLTGLVADGGSLDFLGLPVPVINYSQTVVPILLTVWIMSFIERFFNKVVPDMVRTVFAPFFTVLITLPISLCLLAPLGYTASTALGGFLLGLHDQGGFVAVITIACLVAVYPFLQATGMHVAIGVLGLPFLTEQGIDTFFIASNTLANWAIWAMALALFLRMKDPHKKSEQLGLFISGCIGGVTEPTLFGSGFKYPRLFLGAAAGGFVGGAWMAFTHTGVIQLGASNVLNLLRFVSPERPENFINACIAAALAFTVSTIVGYIVVGKDVKAEEEAAANKA